MTMMLLYGALLVVGITLLAVTVVRVVAGGVTDSSAAPPAAPSGSDGSARRILDERYAAGELSSEDYQHRRRVLEGDE
jgi:putative membrane protein